MGNKANRNIIYDHDKHAVNNDYIKDLRERSEIVNHDKFNVEVAKDFSIPDVTIDTVDSKQPVTGYTAGLITRDLVSMGEKMMEKEKNPKK